MVVAIDVDKAERLAEQRAGWDDSGAKGIDVVDDRQGIDRRSVRIEVHVVRPDRVVPGVGKAVDLRADENAALREERADKCPVDIVSKKLNRRRASRADDAIRR